nr:molybdopterin-dependent oxidoreductase [Paracoccus sp. S-4012]
MPAPRHPQVVTHWGLYRAVMEEGRAVGVRPFDGDVAPSAIGLDLIADRLAPARITAPAVRQSFLEGRRGGLRGAEPFVEVGWDTALDLAAGELDRVRREHGNGAIYGGSYGWGSAGRFHHAQSQLHRFLNCIGGYVASRQNYSFAAGDVILPHVIGSSDGLATHHTPWRLIAGEAELVLCFGGLPERNAQVSSGGMARHEAAPALAGIRAAGGRFVNISPIRDDMGEALGAEWLAIRPGSDTALMLALAHVLIAEGRVDRAFLARCTTGFDRLEAYIMGGDEPRSPEWAEPLTGIPAARIRDLAREMASSRTFITAAWSLQRARHGEQPYWMAVALAAMLGGIGLPGQGFGFGYMSSGGIGQPRPQLRWPSLPQGRNLVADFIPVARIADMLLHPGEPYDYDGERRAYPDIRLVYWCGGNPFHHHQDLHRLRQAWSRPECVIVQDSWWTASARHADIVLPASTFLERNDIAASGRESFIAASHKLFDAPEGVRDDFDIFRGLAVRLGAEPGFSEGLDEAAWVRRLYDEARARVAAIGQSLPEFDAFWTGEGLVELTVPEADDPSLLAGFRADPEAHPLGTPSGLIELASERIASFGYDDCRGHPVWLEPEEWLGAPLAARFPLHLLSNQPTRTLHAQWDHGRHARADRPGGRPPVRLHPDDAAARGIAEGDLVRVFNERGTALASARLSDALRPGVVQMTTGPWFDPEGPEAIGGIDRNGNPNTLTPDRATSRLSQAPGPNSCLVDVARFEGAAPDVRVYEPPVILR